MAPRLLLSVGPDSAVKRAASSFSPAQQVQAVGHAGNDPAVVRRQHGRLGAEVAVLELRIGDFQLEGAAGLAVAVSRVALAVHCQGARAGAPAAAVELERGHGEGIDTHADETGREARVVMQLYGLPPFLAVAVAFVAGFVAVAPGVVRAVAKVAGKVLVVEEQAGVALGEDVAPGGLLRLAVAGEGSQQWQAEGEGEAIHEHGVAPSYRGYGSLRRGVPSMAGRGVTHRGPGGRHSRARLLLTSRRACSKSRRAPGFFSSSLASTAADMRPPSRSVG